MYNPFKNNLRKLKQCLSCKKIELPKTVNDMLFEVMHADVLGLFVKSKYCKYIINKNGIEYNMVRIYVKGLHMKCFDEAKILFSLFVLQCCVVLSCFEKHITHI